MKKQIAVRFIAKEAIAKPSSGWNKEFLGDEKALKISMSHSENYVACVAIIYTIKENSVNL